jgi:hypothetical protein
MSIYNDFEDWEQATKCDNFDVYIIDRLNVDSKRNLIEEF